MIKIAIAEDNVAFRDTLCDVLSMFDDVEVLFTSHNGKSVVHKFLQSNVPPDVVLMDIDMPIVDGISATAKLKALAPGVKVLMLSMFDQEEMVFDAILAGASGYLLKGEKPQHIHRALHDAIENRLPMSPAIASIALNIIRDKSCQSSTPESFALTERELEVLALLAEAKSYKAIAEVLNISEKTVRNHIHNIYGKIQVSSKAEAIKLALENNWFG